MNYFDELKCPLCKTTFNQTDNLPRLLINCGHTLCSKCISQSLTQNNNTITCPEDSSTYENVTNIDISFPKNIYLLKLIQKSEALISSPKSTSKSKLIESIKKATTRSTKKRASFCAIHPTRNLELICIDDKLKICTNCALFGTHRNHNVINIDEFQKDVEVKSELLIDLFDLLDQNMKNDNYTKNVFTLNNKFDNLTNVIDRKYNDISYTVNAFTNDLISKVKQDEKALLDSIANKFDYLKSKINYYKYFPRELNDNVSAWKQKVQNKLNKLNEITDIDEECIKLIEQVNDENGYNCLIEQGDNILNDIDKMNTFPIEQIGEHINKVQLKIDNKVLEDNLFCLENDINFNAVIESVGLSSQKKKPLTKSNGVGCNNTNNNNVTRSSRDEINISNFDTVSEITVHSNNSSNNNNNNNNNVKCSNPHYKMNTNRNKPQHTEHSFFNISDDENLLITNSVSKQLDRQLKCKSRSNMCFDIDSITLNTSSDVNSTTTTNKTLHTCASTATINSSIHKTVINKKTKNKTPPPVDRNTTTAINKDKHAMIRAQFKKDQVNLSRVDIGDDGATLIAELLSGASKSKIKELKLTKCNISDNGGIPLFKAIENCVALHAFNIANNNITNKSLDAIVNMLKRNTSLKSVYFTNNDFNVNAKEKIKSYAGSAKVFI